MILKKYVSLFENISSKINDVAFATLERVKVPVTSLIVIVTNV